MTALFHQKVPMQGQHYKHVHQAPEEQPQVLLNSASTPTDKPKSVHKITVDQNLWNQHESESPAWATRTDTKQRFPLQIETHSINKQNKKALVFRDDKGQACAVICKQPTNDSLEKVQLFGFEPLHEDHKPKWKLQQEGNRPMYRYATFEIDESSTKSYFMMMENGDIYRAQRLGVRKRTGKPRLVSPRPGLFEFEVQVKSGSSYTTSGRFERCAAIQEDPKNQTWDIAVGPGTDPSLIVAFCVMLDVIAVKRCNARTMDNSPYHKKSNNETATTTTTNEAASDGDSVSDNKENHRK